MGAGICEREFFLGLILKEGEDSSGVLGDLGDFN
jgi:hypothetical protein